MQDFFHQQVPHNDTMRRWARNCRVAGAGRAGRSFGCGSVAEATGSGHWGEERHAILKQNGRKNLWRETKTSWIWALFQLMFMVMDFFDIPLVGSTRCEKPEHPHDNLKHRNSRSWLGNLFQVSSAAIRSQIELVAFEPAWLIPAFFLTWCLLQKLLCLGNLCCQKLLSSKPSTVSRGYLYCASTCTIYLPMFNSNSNPGSGISTCQDLEEIFFRSDMQGSRLESGILRKAQKLGQSIEYLMLCWRVWVSTCFFFFFGGGGGGRYSISFLIEEAAN